MVDIHAVFKFFADNPPSILIAGGFLSAIIAAFYEASNLLHVSRNLYLLGGIGIFAGTMLQILWLAKR